MLSVILSTNLKIIIIIIIIIIIFWFTFCVHQGGPSKLM